MVVSIKPSWKRLRGQVVGLDVGYKLSDLRQVRGWEFAHVVLADVDRSLAVDHRLSGNQS